MLNLGARIVLNTFDQNRFQADLAFGITKLLSVELGYVNWFQQRYTGTDYYNRDILRFAVVHKIDLSHKNAATMESK